MAYELLYRDAAHGTAAVITDDLAATATVMVNTLAELGLDAVAGRHDMYLNCSEAVLQLPLHELLPASRVVLEVLESVTPTPAVQSRLRELRHQGFRVALDDYAWSDPRAVLLPVADVVKVDLLAVDPAQLPALLEDLRHEGRILLAEKVEDPAQFKHCQDLGFQLFQGYFFCKPTVLSRRTSAPGRERVLQLLVGIQRPDISIDEAATLVQRDVQVSYRLLRCLNSVAFALREPVESLHHALVLLGIPRVRAWVMLMAVSTLENKPQELVRLAMIRAAMCRELAKGQSQLDGEVMFTVGLFSLLDVMLDSSMDEILEQLPLGRAVSDPLRGIPSKATTLLQVVRAHERGELTEGHEVSLKTANEAWLSAVQWTERTMGALI